MRAQYPRPQYTTPTQLLQFKQLNNNTAHLIFDNNNSMVIKAASLFVSFLVLLSSAQECQIYDPTQAIATAEVCIPFLSQSVSYAV